MKKITASILSVLMMLSMVFSSSVFAANEQPSAWESFVGLFSKQATTATTGVEYRGHIQNKGDYPLDGTWIQGPNVLGTTGESLRLEGFWIRLTNKPANVNIQYRVHVQNVGWMAPVQNGNFAGTEGKAQRIEAIEISLVDDKGAKVTGYSVQYKGHIQYQGDTEWLADGAQLGTTGLNRRLEALEVKIVKIEANMTAYDAAVAQAATAKEEDYTTASYDALTKAVADNVVTKDNTQAEVDAATKAINDAFAALVPGADLTAYNAAVEKAEAVEADLFTTVSYEALTKALADNVVTKDNTADEVAAATAAIEAAIEALVPVADMEAYDAAVAKAEAAVKADYTADSYAALEKALADNVVTNQDSQEDVDAATAAINAAYDALVKVTKVDTVTATGRDKITVTFTAAVNPTTDTLSVKKGTITVNLDGIAYAEDKMTAVLDTTGNLTKGDYTVSLVSGEVKSSATFTAADEKVASIVVTSETAPLNSATLNSYSPNCAVTANYKVLNQYGERMTGKTINWTASTNGNVRVETQPTATADGTLSIGNTTTSTVFIPGTKVYLTGVFPASGAVVNTSVVVGLPSQVDKTIFAGIYDQTTAKVISTLPAGFVDGRYVLLFEVQDQYGNKITSLDMTKLTMISSYPLFVASPVTTTSTQITVNNVLYESVPLARGTYYAKGGTTTISSISNQTGTTATFDITSDAAPAVKTFTLLSPTAVVAEGETAVIPFEAYDQFGNAIKKYSDISGKVTFSGSGLTLGQYADGTAKLTMSASDGIATPTSDAPVYLTSLVTDGGNFSSQVVYVKDKAVPTVVAGIDTADTTRNVSTTIAQGATQTLYATDLNIQDQYGRILTDTQVNNWMNLTANSAIILDSLTASNTPFEITSSASGTDAARHSITSATDMFTVTGKPLTTGITTTESLTFSLSDTSTGTLTPLSGSAKAVTFTLGTDSTYASFEVADMGTMYNDGVDNSATDPKYNKTLKVYGVKADGTKVLLPVTQYSVSTTGKLDTTSVNGTIKDVASSGYVAAEFKASDADTEFKKILEVPITVTVNNTSGATAGVVTATLKVSHATNVVATTTFLTTEVTDGASFVEAGSINAARLAQVFDTSKTKDQYGVVFSPAAPSITISDLVKVTGSNLTVTGNATAGVSIASATAGDKFKATYTYAGGYSTSVNFTVTGSDITAPGATATPTTPNGESTGGYLNAAELTAGVDFECGLAKATSGVVAGDKLQILVGGVPVAEYTLTDTEITADKYTFTLTADAFGADGSKSITTRIVDMAGNIGAQNATPLVVTKDTIAPTVVVGTGTKTLSATSAQVTFDENVAITTPVVGLFKANAANTPDETTAPVVNNDVVTLTFPALTFSTGTASVLDYTPSATADNNVTDIAGNPVAAFTDAVLAASTF